MLLAMAVITKQSPDGTAFTLPLYHPVVAPAVDDAISTAKINLPTKSTKLETNSGVIMLGKTRLFFADPHHNILKLNGKKGPMLYASQTQERIAMIEMTMTRSKSTSNQIIITKQ